MSLETSFPAELLLHQPERRGALLQAFYETHHRQNRNIGKAKHCDRKVRFFTDKLREFGITIDLGIDLGCRGGVLTQHLMAHGRWLGVDIDTNAIIKAHERGIPCTQSDISVAIDFKDESFDAVALTEVLEHLPYPVITIREVHRIL